jgi:hypothetical protein
MVRMDKLLEAWRADPKVDATVELCAMLIRAALKAAPQKLLPDNFVIMFASEARAKHPTNLDVAIAVTDLYLVSGLMRHAAAVMEMAEKLAPQDNRVKERLGKVRRSPTKEFATTPKRELRAVDPETLDAPTTPLDPPTEREALLPSPGRRPTTIGLPAAPPPLPAPLDRRTKVGLNRASVVDKQEVTEGDTQTETNTNTLSEILPHPRRQKTALFGVVDEVDDDAPPTKVETTAPPVTPGDARRPDAPALAPGAKPREPIDDDAPPTNVGLEAAPAASADGSGRTGGRRDESSKSAAPTPAASPRPAETTRISALDPASSFVSDEDDAPPTAVQAVDERTRALSERPTMAEPTPALAKSGPPASGLPRPVPLGAPGAAKPLPRTLSSEVSSQELRDKLPGPLKQRNDGWAKRPDPAVARPGASPQAVGGSPSLAIPPVPKADEDDSPPTRVGAPQEPADSAARSDSKVAARKPQAERRPVRSFPALEEVPDIPTRVGETPDDLFGPVTHPKGPSPAAPVGGRFPVPSAEPSDPETVTTTNVRAPPVVPRRGPEGPSEPGAAPRPLNLGELGEPSTLSGAITNLWSPTQNPVAPRPAAPRDGASNAPSGIPHAMEDSQSALDVSQQDLLQDDDDDAAVTGLKELPAPTEQRSPVGFSGTPSVAAPVVKGGTLAMHLTNAPSAFPPVPPSFDDDSDVPRTQVLNAQEALRAATADPRPPNAASRAPVPGSRAQPSTVTRGVMVGGADPSLPSPPPAVAPTFGAPPSRSSPLLQSGMNPMLQSGAFAASGALSAAPGVAAHSTPYPGSGSGGGFGAPVAVASTPFPGQPALEVVGTAPVAMYPSQVADPLALVPLDALQRPMLASQEVFVPTAAPYGSQQGPRGPELVPAPMGRVPLKLYLAFGAAMLAVFGLVGYAAYLLLRTPEPAPQTTAGTLPKAVDDALVKATPSSLAYADVELTKLEVQPSPELASARLRHRVLTALEVSGSDESLAASIEKARGEGADEATLGFALVAEATLRNDLVLAAKRAEPARVTGEKSALFRYVNGVLLERLGSPDARSEYASAMSLTPGFGPPKLRLLRLQVLAEEREPLEVARQEAALDPPALAALEAWEWAVRAANGRAASEPPPTLSMTSADVSRTLHPVFSAVALLKKGPDPKGAPTDPTLKQAIVDAESPSLATFFGTIAARRGDEAGTVLAAERALALAPSYTPAIGLLSENALRTGRYQELLTGSKALSPITNAALRSLVAYETGDAATLGALSKSEIASIAELSQVRLALLVGPTLPSDEAMSAYRAKDPVHGELCAVDRLVLLGEVVEARKIVASWSDGATHAARALRVGRVLRAEGAFTEADKSLLVAPSGWQAQVERVLVGAEARESRSRARSLASDDRAGPAGPFAEAFIIARDGDVDLAKAKLASAKLPSDSAPWLERIVATLALVEVDDERGAARLSSLSGALPKNTDLSRAAARAAERRALVEKDEPGKRGPAPPKPRNRR